LNQKFSLIILLSILFSTYIYSEKLIKKPDDFSLKGNVKSVVSSITQYSLLQKQNTFTFRQKEPIDLYFDSKGRVIKTVYYHKAKYGSTRISYISKYDENGRLLMKQAYDNGHYEGFTMYDYYHYGQIKKVTAFRRYKKRVISERFFKYDKFRRLLSEYKLRKKKKPKYFYLYLYDKKNRIKEKREFVFFRAIDNFSKTNKMTKKDFPRKITITFLKGKMLNKRIFYTYYKTGIKKSQRTITYGHKRKVKYDFLKKFDKHGILNDQINLLQKKSKAKKTSNFNFKRNIKYNKNKQRFKEYIKYRFGDYSYKRIFTYKYDVAGNWISKKLHFISRDKTKITENEITFIKRMIKYYKK